MENYFNYFTEIEECFRRCRGTATLLSPLDWALIESWKDAGLPLEAVLAGIGRSFEKYAKRPQRFRQVNSLAYCTPEVLRAAEDARRAEVESGGRAGEHREPAAPFTPEEVAGFLDRCAGALERAAELARERDDTVVSGDLAETAAVLRNIAMRGIGGSEAEFEDLERQLTAIEDKLVASLTRAASVERLADVRRQVDRGLAAYRSKMTAAQIESLERKFLKQQLFEHYQLPRLSLFYL